MGGEAERRVSGLSSFLATGRVRETAEQQMERKSFERWNWLRSVLTALQRCGGGRDAHLA